MKDRDDLTEVVAAAWRSFEKAALLGPCVKPAMPILFFGDLDAYAMSPLRVLTVGLNPSRNEFPASDPFGRFLLAEGVASTDQERYLNALSAYFRTDPYAKWFRNFELLLNAMHASYYNRQTSRALHTDICSPVSTDPTWNGLSRSDQALLVADGDPLWHELVASLRPSVVILSVASTHLKRISFEARGRWQPIHTFNHKADGAPRRHPYTVCGRWHVIDDEPALFVFCPANHTPIMGISDDQKRELGPVITKAYLEGRSTHRTVQHPRTAR